MPMSPGSKETDVSMTIVEALANGRTNGMTTKMSVKIIVLIAKERMEAKTTAESHLTISTSTAPLINVLDTISLSAEKLQGRNKGTKAIATNKEMEMTLAMAMAMDLGRLDQSLINRALFNYLTLILAILSTILSTLLVSLLSIPLRSQHQLETQTG